MQGEVTGFISLSAVTGMYREVITHFHIVYLDVTKHLLLKGILDEQ